MTQKQILDFFSPSNLPPKKREREGEPPVVNRGKRKKSAAQQQVVRKRENDNAAVPVPKKIKLNDNRAIMERAVEDRNELFNVKCELRSIQDIKRGGVTLETINVNSLVDVGRTNRMLKQWGNDITVMVDTRIPESRTRLFRSNNMTVMSTNKTFRGVMIQISKKLDPELIEVDEENANYVAVAFDLDGKKIGLLGIYAPNNDDPKFFRETINKVVTKMTLKTDELIVAGDMNVNLSQGIGYSNNKKEALEECLKIWSLKDTVEYSIKKSGIFHP